WIARIVSALARSTCARSAIMALRPFCTLALYCSFSAGRVNSCRCECGSATAPTSGISYLPCAGIIGACVGEGNNMQYRIAPRACAVGPGTSIFVTLIWRGECTLALHARCAPSPRRGEGVTNLEWHSLVAVANAGYVRAVARIQPTHKPLRPE